jgi:hypothetical protein
MTRSAARFTRRASAFLFQMSRSGDGLPRVNRILTDLGRAGTAGGPFAFLVAADVEALTLPPLDHYAFLCQFSLLGVGPSRPRQKPGQQHR